MAEYKKSKTCLILGGNKGRDHSGIVHVHGGDDSGDKRQFCAVYRPTTYHADNHFASIFTRYPGAKKFGSPAWTMEIKTVPADTVFPAWCYPSFEPKQVGVTDQVT